MSEPLVIHHSGWPWPLDSVQNWFDGLWMGIQDWIRGGSALVWSIVPEPFKTWFTVWGQIGAQVWEGILAFWRDPVGMLSIAFNAVSSAVVSTGAWIVEQLTNGVAGIQAYVGPILSQAWEGLLTIGGIIGGALSNFGTWISGIIWGWFDGALKWATDSFTWLWGSITQGLTDIWNHITRESDRIATQIEGGVGGALEAATEVLAETAGSLKTWVNDALTGVAGALGSGLVAFFQWLIDGARGLASAIIGAAKFVKDAVVGPVIDFGREFAQGLLDNMSYDSPDKQTKDLLQAFTVAYQDQIYNLIPEKGSVLPPLGSLIAASTGVIGLNVVAALGSQSLGLALDLAHPVKNMGFRNISENIVNSFAMPSMIGPLLGAPVWPGIIVPLRYHMNALFPNMLPGVQDLIRFVVREVISPEEFYEIMPFHGYSQIIAEWFWMAHWVLPSIGNIYTAYHRGVVTKDERDKYLVLHDYSPIARPGIEKSDVEIMGGIIKTLIPRVDGRYAWETDEWSDDDLIKHYRKLGYEEDAELMARIQISRAMIEEVNKVRNEKLADFVEGHIDEATLRANLSAINISSTRIDYYVAYALNRRQRDYRKDLLHLFKDGYMKDLIDLEILRLRVSEIIVIPEVVDLFVEMAYIDKFKKPKAVPAPDPEKALREVNKYRISYAILAYRKYGIDKLGLIVELTAADVDPDVARARADYEELKRPVPKPSALEISKAKEQARIQSIMVQVARVQFRDYITDEDEFLVNLQAAGLSPELALAEMQLESLKRPVPDISPEELERRRIETTVKRLRLLTYGQEYRDYEMSKEELLAALITAGYDPMEASAQADLQEARLPPEKPTEEELKEKRDLNRARKFQEKTALELYRARAIDRTILENKLKALGYAAELVESIVHYEEVKLALEVE